VERAAAYWRTLVSDPGAKFDTTHVFDAATVKPQVTWGTSPEMVVSIEDRVPDPDRERDASAAKDGARAGVHGLAPNVPMTRHPHRQGLHRLVHELADRGSARGRERRARAPRSVATCGSRWSCRFRLVKAQAEAEGLDRTFRDAGFEWREPAARCASR
jgi:3-isopropylmalate/(R)-2-methylmalate dehydratase large subunit